MVVVPAGPFIMGDDQGWNEAQPRHQVDLPQFYIDKYEVSIDQFRKFVAAGGYEYDRYWESAPSADLVRKKELQPSHWDELMRLPGDLPVCYVRYSDAAAYCKWAGKHLPSAAQWEKAARGTDGRRYPWGDNWMPGYANTITREMYDSGQETSAHWPMSVMAFPEGESPYGARQMSGNVWEWVSGGMDFYPDNPKPYKYYPFSAFVFFPELRGGSWTMDERFCTVTFRNFNYEDLEIRTYGFRCACETIPDLPPAKNTKALQ